MNARELRPDALIIGAPKAGTSALHAALSRHPGVYASPIKEPKFYLCGEAPPPAYRGPGDAHSQQEWVWRRADYEQLFAGAPENSVRIESTPFYLYDADARRRLADELPDAKFIAIVRDPIDRAYSNWMHLWVDGLEPIANSWSRPVIGRGTDGSRRSGRHFGIDRRMGRYGEQLADLFSRVDRSRVLVDALPGSWCGRCRRDPGPLLSGFLGLAEGQISGVPPDDPPARTSNRVCGMAVLGRMIRAGAYVGSFAPPQISRQISKPLVGALHLGGPEQRPEPPPEPRLALLQTCTDDIAALEDVSGSPSLTGAPPSDAVVPGKGGRVRLS